MSINKPTNINSKDEASFNSQAENYYDHSALSKVISHALRHEPSLYNLELDEFGWANLSDLENSLINRGINTNIKQIIEMVFLSEKKRHEIVGAKIRAFYGHSTVNKIVKTYSQPPHILFHGTIALNVDEILTKGLLPMSRQYVHLSINPTTAKEIASRKKGRVILIKVNAYEAYKSGIRFYNEKNDVWLSDFINSEFLYL
jgi:putative RNA 2'-phosphotransferase